MAEIRTFEVVLERIVTEKVTVKWEVNAEEFREWAGHDLADTHPGAVKDFLMSDRYYDDALRDKIQDAYGWKQTDFEPKILDVIL